jgi:REP element-mobilizing transposase RayT
LPHYNDHRCQNHRSEKGGANRPPPEKVQRTSAPGRVSCWLGEPSGEEDLLEEKVRCTCIIQGQTMPQKRPEYLPNQYYHFYNRDAHRVSIFREPDNYLYVLRKVKHYLAEFDLTMIVYCLMPNHYHFVMRQDGEHAAGLLPQRVFKGYSKAYNKRYGHSGTLFEDTACLINK